MTFGKNATINKIEEVIVKQGNLGDIIKSAMRKYRLYTNGYREPKRVELNGDVFKIKPISPLTKWEKTYSNGRLLSNIEIKLDWFNADKPLGYVDRIENNVIYVGEA